MTRSARRRSCGWLAVSWKPPCARSGCLPTLLQADNTTTMNTTTTATATTTLATNSRIEAAMTAMREAVR